MLFERHDLINIITSLFVILKYLLPVIREWVVSLSAIAGVIIAYYGLRTWREQLRGKSEYNIARQLLKTVYKIRNAIQFVRHPFMSANETIRAIDSYDNLSEKEIKKMSNHQRMSLVYEKRWEMISDSMAELQIIELDAEVIWGKDITAKLKPLYDCIRHLNAAFNVYFTFTPDRHTDLWDADEKRKYEKIIFKMSDNPEEDKFAIKIQNVVSDIENFVKPHINL